MTTPHPTPEEGMTPEERYEALCRVFEHTGHALAGFQADAVMKSIREAEAAGEARGRAMERKEITARARRLRKRFGKCEGSFREEIIWEHGLRIEKMIRARTDKENSND